jgi:VWFA-related protein
MLLLILAALAFAAAPGGSQDSTVFRSNTQLVQINVIVRDKNGPVKDLNQSDFTLTDRGKSRTISVFSMNKEEGAPDALALPVNTFSNRPLKGAAPASVTMILLDRLNTLIASGPSAREKGPVFDGELALANAKQHLLKFVDVMRPRDRIAIYSLGTSLTVLSDFTGDGAQLKTILQAYRATSITTRESAEPGTVDVCPPNDPNGCPINGGINRDRQVLAAISNGARAETTMNALLALAEHVAGIPGRKNLLWLTSDLMLPAEAVGRALSRYDVAIYPVDARGLLPFAEHRTGEDVSSNQPMSAGAAAAMGLSPGASSQPVGVSTMEKLAEETGGRAFINTNDLTGAIRTTIDDGTVTYTLGFYVDSTSLDGKFHDLKVQVRRKGLEVRTQRGYFALKDVAGPNPASALIVPMMSPLESSSIHLLARVERAAGGLSISGSVDLRDLQLEQTADSSKGAIDIYLVQQDATGKTIERLREHMQVQLTREEYDANLKTGLVFRTVLNPKDGLKTLRVVVMDSAHASMGSLIIPVGEIK